MKCAFCAHEFDEADAASGCGACGPGRCHGLRCPQCGYEAPAELEFIKAFRRWRERRQDKNRVGQPSGPSSEAGRGTKEQRDHAAK